MLAGLPALTLGLAVLLGDDLRPVEVPSFAAAQVTGLLSSQASSAETLASWPV